ncbi:MAG: YihY/virulence factor BrkB family protein [Polyangiaceae bacterium]
MTFASSIKRLGRVFVSAGTSWVDDEAYRLGASLSYYALFSLFPLLMLGATLVGVALGNDPAARHQVLDFFLGGLQQEQVRTMMDGVLTDMQKQSSARGLGAIVGVLGLLLGASSIFGELDTALNRIWKVKLPTPIGIKSIVWGIVHDKLASFALVALSCVAAIITFAADLFIGAFGSRLGSEIGMPWLFDLASPLASIAIGLLIMTGIFMLIPQRKVPFGSAFAGAVVSSALLFLLRAVFGLYLKAFTGYAAYGVVGGMLALVTWIYLAAVVVLYGAEFSRAWHDSRSVAVTSERGETPQNPSKSG